MVRALMSMIVPITHFVSAVAASSPFRVRTIGNVDKSASLCCAVDRGFVRLRLINVTAIPTALLETAVHSVFVYRQRVRNVSGISTAPLIRCAKAECVYWNEIRATRSMFQSFTKMNLYSLDHFLKVYDRTEFLTRSSTSRLGLSARRFFYQLMVVETALSPAGASVKASY